MGSQTFWKGSVVLISSILATPILTILFYVFYPSTDIWNHLVDTVLIGYVLNSLALMVGVACGTLILGVSAAWVVSAFEFPGRKVFEWALLLPMAMPAYILAYTYSGLFGFTGPVQTGLRSITGWGYGDYWFPEIHSLGGAITVISLVLYPYVYLLSRTAFIAQSNRLIEASQSLGARPVRRFFKVVVPLARPAIIAGLSLVLMETLADYGTVQYFGLNTFTTGIFRTWFGLGDSAAAAKLSALLLVFVFALLMLELWSRRQRRFHEGALSNERLTRQTLSIRDGWKLLLLAQLVCFVPVAFGFLLPVSQLIFWVLTTAEESFGTEYWTLVLNSLSLAGAASLSVLLLAIVLSYGKRLVNDRVVKVGVRLASIGYAIPGTVVAVGVMVPFAWLDNQIDQVATDTFNVSTGLLLSGTVFAVLFAYAVRFLSVSIQAIDSGLEKIKPSMDDSARSLGLTPLLVLKRVHVPLLRSSVVTAILLVFVDVLKELPATLILRPFNYNTLAVRVYELASDERLADAAVGSLTILLIGLIPIIMLSRHMVRGDE